MFPDQSSERIAPGGALCQSARVSEKHGQEAAHQKSAGGTDAQQKVSIRLVIRHYSLTLETRHPRTSVFMLGLESPSHPTAAHPEYGQRLELAILLGRGLLRVRSSRCSREERHVRCPNKIKG